MSRKFEDFEYEGENTSAKWIKGLAIFSAIVGIIISISAGSIAKNAGIAIGGSIASILGVLTLYGFGELIQIADDIKENSEYIRANSEYMRAFAEKELNKKK